ncbi:hypothetical protein DEO72_LG5g2419 [Vigna unguiculata]|uniref:Uncharacterized protein n=1 Tax=Vigna unguiculata TaxID=3917 RepID=A0A4D6M2B9_VIGUN|nr:hypothetical protein DEO72_LG5g2419 [Vigna unguiculata]
MEQWESLDLDEVELQSFMRRCSGNTSLIHGPTRNYQAVIMNRKWATMFIKHHGLVERGDMKNVTPMYTKKVFDKLSFMVCVVKECKGNVLGDLLLTVKMNHTEPVAVNPDVEPIVQQNVEMNVDSNLEHLKKILLQTVEDSSEDEEMTYISIDDRIKSLVDSFKKFKNTQAGQSSKSQP